MLPYVYIKGEMAEWSIAFDLKSNDTMYPWVRIPLSPIEEFRSLRKLVKKLNM